jgi:acetylornithine deacetylase/succinyl-diaminopimelate desuccinylase-like protein
MSMTHTLLQELDKETDSILTTIKELVEIESPTTDRQACNRLASYLQSRLEKLGMIVRRIPGPDFGDHVSAALPGDNHDNPGIFLQRPWERPLSVGSVPLAMALMLSKNSLRWIG